LFHLNKKAMRTSQTFSISFIIRKKKKT